MDVRQDFAKMKPAARKRVIEAIKWMKKKRREGADFATVKDDAKGGVYQRYVDFHSQGGVEADIRDFALVLPPAPKDRLHSIVIDGEVWENKTKPPVTDVGLEAFLKAMPITPGGFVGGGGPFNETVVIPATHVGVLTAQINKSPFAAITLRIIPDGATAPIDKLFAGAVTGAKYQLDTYRMAHRSPAFLPWHRVILRLFERDLQFADKNLKNDGKITLPYWNWSRDNDWDEKAKSSVWHKANFGGFNTDVEGTITGDHFAGSDWPLFAGGAALTGIASKLRRLRKAEQKTASDTLPLPDGAFPTAKAVETVIAQTEYIGDKRGGGGAGDGSGGNHRFAGQLEHRLHDHIHPLVGGIAVGPRTTDGQMSDGLFSPQDPIFWLFHCNVDRLWSRWQSLHDKNNDSKYPTFGMLPGRRLDDPMEPWAGAGANVPPYEFKVTIRDVLNAANLGTAVNADNLLGKGYKYDTLTL